MEYPGDIVEAGDCIRYRGTVSRVESLTLKDIPDRAKSGYVDVTLAAGHPILTRFLKRSKTLSAGQGVQMSIGESIPVVTGTPGLPDPCTASPLPRGVLISITPPLAWADGGDAEFDVDALRYKVTLLQAGDVFDVIEDGKGTRFQFLMSKAEAAVGAYYATVEAFGPDGTSTGVCTTNTTTPEGIVAEGIDDNSIDYPKFVASLGGLHWMNVAPSTDGSGIHYVPGTAAGAPTLKKAGDACYNAYDAKMYRYDGINWITALDGQDVLANSITANKLFVNSLEAITAILGNVTAGSLTSVSINSSTITGGVFRTAASGQRLEINPSLRGTDLTWFDSSGFTTAAIESGSDYLRLIGGDVTLELGSSVAVLYGGLRANGLVIGTDTGDPPTGFGRLYKSGNSLYWKASGQPAVLLS